MACLKVCFLKTDTEDPWNKVANESSHIGELWIWLTDTALFDNIEEQSKMIPKVYFGPPQEQMYVDKHANTQDTQMEKEKEMPRKDNLSFLLSSMFSDKSEANTVDYIHMLFSQPNPSLV